MLFEAFKAFIVGLVEGITEWLPISSTGHMILVDEFLKLDVSDAFLGLFLVVIQIGAIMAVIISCRPSAAVATRESSCSALAPETISYALIAAMRTFSPAASA